MSFQTRWSVGVRHLVTGEPDAHGVAAESHGDPVDLPVYFVAPASTIELYTETSDLLTTDLAVFCPKANDLPGPRDLVLWQGEEYRVEGDVSDFTFGPFRGPGSDVSFIIRRTEAPMRSRCTIERLTGEDVWDGEKTTSAVEVLHTDIPCRLEVTPVTSRSVLTGQLVTEETPVVKVPSDIGDVRPDDRVTVHGAGVLWVTHVPVFDDMTQRSLQCRWLR